MRGIFKWKVLILFCSTFLLGFFSFDISNSLLPKETLKENHSLPLIKEQQIKGALKLTEEENIECVPLDKNLKYHYIQNKVADFDLDENGVIEIKKRTKLLQQILKIEEKLEKEKNLNIDRLDKRIELLKNLNKLREKYNKLYKEQLNIDDSIDLLYREVCKENK